MTTKAKHDLLGAAITIALAVALTLLLMRVAGEFGI
jgi:hypothetical protein